MVLGLKVWWGIGRVVAVGSSLKINCEGVVDVEAVVLVSKIFTPLWLFCGDIWEWLRLVVDSKSGFGVVGDMWEGCRGWIVEVGVGYQNGGCESV